MKKRKRKKGEEEEKKGERREKMEEMSFRGGPTFSMIESSSEQERGEDELGVLRSRIFLLMLIEAGGESRVKEKLGESDAIERD